MKEKLVVILGPTACGKTALSIKIAQELNGEVISGDSMQVYRGMDIGTAKVSQEEMQNIPHHLIDIRNPDESYHVADFQKLCRKLITRINRQNKIPILVGGTGLYISSVIDPYYCFPDTVSADPTFRQKKRQEVKQFGSAALYNELVTIDPLAAEKIHPNNIPRLIRALEIYYQSGHTMTELLTQGRQSDEIPYDLVIIGLTLDREKLYQRINLRVDQMIEDGLVDEVKRLLNDGYHADLPSMQGIGYKQIISYLYGLASLEEAITHIKQDTRHFAKRQWTWFKRDTKIQWFDLDDYLGGECLTKGVLECIKQKIGEE